MDLLNTRYAIGIIIAFMVIVSRPEMLIAEGINATVGLKTNYSSGVSDTNIAYKPFGKIGYNSSFLNFELTGMYTLHQQITDGMGNFTEINTGQGQIKTLLKIDDVLELGGGYSLAKGEKSYDSRIYMISGSVYLGNLSFDVDYSKEDQKYKYNNDIEITGKSFFGSLGYDITDYVGIEFEYNYMSSDYSNLDYIYNKKVVRAGMSVYYDTTMYMAGISSGKDSGDYWIYGFDAGFSIKLLDAFKFMLLYNYDYYKAPSTISLTTSTYTGQKGKGNSLNINSGSYYKGSNPNFKSSVVGESLHSHSLSVSASYMF